MYIYTVNGQYAKLFDFKDSILGSYPTGNLINVGEYFYGMTGSGGINNFGVIFKIKSDGTGFIKLLDFDSTNGCYPQGSLISDGTFLYGMTFSGGKYGKGTIFKIRLDGTGDSVILNFTDSTGYEPLGSLFYDGTFLYGMTMYGGTNSDAGVIFKIMLDGRGYTKLHQFNYDEGYNPNGSLISDGNFLFGMTFVGGNNGPGSIFKIKKDGTSFTSLHDFNRLDGGNPAGSLFYDGSFLYGMTNAGGSSGFNSGTIFKIKPNGTEFSSIFNMNYGEGSNPCGDLISDGTFL
jgi:uncharacterized repeat protein (TIGR03803 family)